MGFFELSLRLNGFEIGKASKELKRIQQLNDTDFSAHLEQQKKAIVSYHLANNTFYKAFLKDTDYSEWNSLPTLKKQDFQVPIADRLSRGFSHKNVYINKTSGSSGSPFIFAKDKWSHALTWAVIKNRFSWYDIRFGKQKQARFYGIPLDKKGYYKERIKDFFANRYRFSIFDLSDSAFEQVLAKFKHTDFVYLNGYTSAIVQFAKYLKRNYIFLNDVCPSLKWCFVTSEMLFEDDKLLMEKQFGVPIINEYGASELDLIAFQNRQGEFVLNNETLFVEVLDDDDNPVEQGKEGRIVITSLYNKAHPFIRYEIGDIGILTEKSTLKQPVLKKLVGRTNDIAVLPSGKKAAGLTFYYITKSIIEDQGLVKEFIITQTALDHFVITYASKLPLSEEKIDTIKKEMIRYLEPDINLEFLHRQEIKRLPSGKLKQFTSTLTTTT